MKILIFGGRLWAQEVADLARQIPGVEVAGFVENLDRERCLQPFDGLPVYWMDDAVRLAHDHLAIGGMGTTHRRQLLEQVRDSGFRFATLVHPSAQVSPSSRLGEGSLVSAGAIVASHTQLGEHVIINRGALIGHHLKIGSYSTVGPGANLGGDGAIGEGVYIGIGATLVDRLSVGDGSVVGAASVVTRDVPKRVLVYGSPARIMKENIEGR